MRRLFMCMAAVLALAGTASARDWGFSKDTAHQKAYPYDTVYVVNHGTDTLHFDSAFVEIIQAPGAVIAVWTSWYPYQYSAETPVSSATLGVENRRGLKFTYTGGVGRVLPGDSIILSGFNVSECLCVSKKTAAFAVGDSLKARLRFRSTMGEEDTLVVLGMQQPGVGVRAAVLPREGGVHRAVLGRDPRGRLVSPESRLPALRAKPRR